MEGKKEKINKRKKNEEDLGTPTEDGQREKRCCGGDVEGGGLMWVNLWVELC